VREGFGRDRRHLLERGAVGNSRDVGVGVPDLVASLLAFTDYRGDEAEDAFAFEVFVFVRPLFAVEDFGADGVFCAGGRGVCGWWGLLEGSIGLWEVVEGVERRERYWKMLWEEEE
jgi:hypothetical protein